MSPSRPSREAGCSSPKTSLRARWSFASVVASSHQPNSIVSFREAVALPTSVYVDTITAYEDAHRRLCVSAVGCLACQSISKQIKMPDVPGGLLDHVHENPAKIDRTSPERRNRCDMVERSAERCRSPAALAGRHVQPDDHVSGVVGSESHRVIRVIGTRSVPRRRHRRSEQPTLEPTILCPREMSHDPGDREISCRQHTSGGLIPWGVHQHSRRDRPVLIESLDQRRPFVCRLKVWVHDRPIVHASSLASQRNRCLTYRRLGDALRVAASGSRWRA